MVVAYVYLKSGIDFNVITQKGYLNCQQVVIHLLHSNVHLSALYRAPESNIEDYLAILDSELELFPRSIWIGDININLLAKHNSDKQRIHKYKSMLSSNNFQILNDVSLQATTIQAAAIQSLIIFLLI